MTRIHPTAIVDKGAQLHESVEVGPYTVIGPHVRVGKGTRIAAHCVIDGHTTIGEDNQIFPFNSLGAIPQDKKYAGEPCELAIGDRNTVREFCTFNIGTAGDKSRTSIGDDNWIMVYVHLAHDCEVGNNTIFANNSSLAGHVQVGDFVILGGFTTVHQFCRIGAHAFIGGLSGVENDVIPYGIALGNRAHLAGLNMVGLKRRGFSREAIQDIRRAYRLLFAEEGTLQERIEDVQGDFADDPIVIEILDFLRASGTRSVCTPRDSKAA